MSNVRNLALHYLSGLSHKEFAEFFYESVRERNTSDFKEWQGHFILANTEKIEDDEPWDVDLIAVNNDGEKWVDDAPICQSGTCMQCGCNVRSWAKKAICPVCNVGVHCS